MATNKSTEEESLVVPYLSKIDGLSIQPGHCLLVSAEVVGDHFEISFKTSSDDSAKVPLNFAWSKADRAVTLNTFDGTDWGMAKRRKVRLAEKDTADVRIRFLPNRFEVFLNRQLVQTMRYRQAIMSIGYLNVTGEVLLHRVDWVGKCMAVPYEFTPAAGLGTGRSLHLSGLPLKKATRISVSLFKGDEGDVALHVSLRFDERRVVRNSLIDQKWQNEEREGKLCLAKDALFDLQIINEPYAFQVLLNGSHFCAYAHRTDPTKLTKVSVDGDFELFWIEVK